MEIRYLQKDEYYIWNQFIDSSPQGSLYGRTWYLDALNIKYSILVVIHNSQIMGGIVLAKNELNCYSNPLLVKYLGIYFTPFTGFNKYNITNEKIKISNVIIDNIYKIKTFDYFFHPSYDNWIPFYWKGYKQQIYYSYRIDLKSLPSENIFSNFYKTLKTEIKFAENSGLIVEEDIKFDAFYEIHNKSFLRQGGKSPFNKKLLGNYYNVLNETNALKSFGIKDANNNLIAVAAITYDDNCAYLVLNGIDKDLIARGTNELLLFETLKFASTVTSIYDFEGSMLQPIESFYRKFGGIYTPYMRIWKNSALNTMKLKAIDYYKKIKYGK